MNVIRSRLISTVVGATALVVLAGTPATSAAVQPVSFAAPTALAPASVLGVWYTPRSNHFYTEQACINYGEWAIDGGIADASNYICYRNPGQSKWSIDVWLNP